MALIVIASPWRRLWNIPLAGGEFAAEALLVIAAPWQNMTLAEASRWP
jgi:hypothetical protein